MRGASLASAIVVIAGCSGAGQPLIGGGGDAAAGGEGGVGADAGDDATSTGHDAAGGACNPSPPDGGACSSLTPPASSVTIQCESSQPIPQPTGGTILDGVYLMTSATYYADGATCPPEEVDHTMWLVCGTSWQTAQTSTVTGQPPYTLIANATVLAASTTLDITLTCGSNAPPLTFGYDASGGTLRLHVGDPAATSGRVDTFERQ